ncbi:hypothetical protein B0H12DRAFT_1243592 [Mycena haematopus]|nr:hypothetical protein B0H12DRAFT_1243592 [Mycena haematopus]
MDFEGTPSPPAQTNPVTLKPPTLRGLPIWAYLALGFVIISTISVLCYIVSSCYYAVKLNALNATHLPQHSVESGSKTKRPSKKKAWRHSKSSSSQQQPMLSNVPMDQSSSYQVDHRMGSVPLAHGAYVPLVAFPMTALPPPAKSRTLPTYDMHNICFASPSNLAIYNNPKLAPVAGSAVPLSYDSQNNLFGNPFTPTTMPIRKEKSAKRNMSAFRSKSRSRLVDKENYKTLPGQREATF